MYILKDKEGIIHEVDALLEISEKKCTEKILEIVSSLAEAIKNEKNTHYRGQPADLDTS